MSEKTKMKFHIIAIFCLLIFCFSLTPVTFQNDTYYSIAIGRHIVETKTIDMQDPFSWHENLSYPYPHWGYDLATYLVYQLGETIGIGGFCSLYIATVLLAMVLGILIYYIMNKFSKNPVVSFMLSMMVMYLLKDFITARAQLVSYILLSLTVLFIDKYLKTKQKKYVVGLLIIPIILANMHCAVWPFYFVLYLPYIAEYFIAIFVDLHLNCNAKLQYVNWKLKRAIRKKDTESIEYLQNRIVELQLEKEKQIEITKRRRENPYKIVMRRNKATKWLIVIMLICLLSGLLTPLGDVPYTYYFKTMEGNTTQNISEHQPLTLINNKNMLVAFTAYILLLVFTDTKAELHDLFMLAGITLLTLMSRRQAALFAIICGFIFAKLVTNLLEKYDKEGTKIVMKYATTIIGRILILVIILLLGYTTYKGKIDDQYVNESSYPVQACDYILANIDIENMRIYNEYNYGSYMLYRGIPVFIDSRADLYAPEFNGIKNAEGKYEGRDIFSDYINVSNIGTYYEDKMEAYNITHVILVKNSKLNMFISRDSRYNELYSDEHFVFYERLAEN